MTFALATPPCSATDAATRAVMLAREKTGQYILGTGDYDPRDPADRPWTDHNGRVGSDCAGFAMCWCYKIRRHQPGFNRGAWASVSDDINCNSGLEDAQNLREIFELVVDAPRVGDLLLYPTFRIATATSQLEFIGHVAIVVGVMRQQQSRAPWNRFAPAWELLDVAQCKGPNGRAPAVVLTDGSIWSHHDTVWPKPQHRSYLLRVRAQAPTFRQP